MVLCSVHGCENVAGVPGSARGLCRAHYRRWQRYGSETEPSRRLQSYQGDRCAEEGCASAAKVTGLCENHYAVTRRRADPEGNRRRLEAFKARARARQEKEMGRPRPVHCEMCGGAPSGRGNKPLAGICFDHDHLTGKPRGWLCDRCNKVLGLVGDDVSLLDTMARYLEIHNGASEVVVPLKRRAA